MTTQDPLPLSLARLVACGERFTPTGWATHQQECEPCGEVPF